MTKTPAADIVERRIERAHIYAKSPYCTPEEHDDIMAAVNAARERATEIEALRRKLDEAVKALKDAGVALDWAARRTKGKLSGSEVTTITVASGEVNKALASIRGGTE